MTLVIILISFAQIVCGTPLTQAKNAKPVQPRQMMKCDRKVRRTIVMGCVRFLRKMLSALRTISELGGTG